MEDIQAFRKDKIKWADEWVNDMVWHGYYASEEKAREAVESRVKHMEEDLQLMDQFESFINKLDTTCGGLLGEGDGVVYEKVIVTECKTEFKAIETASGAIKEGQLFILKSNFTYGCRKGLVYRIHESEYDGKKTYHAYKLNGKLTKECIGRASSNNYWYIGTGTHDNITKWIENGSIAWCELQEVKIPYEVEKVVKKTIKADKSEKKTETTTEGEQAATQETNINNYTYQVSEDTDTRDGSRIYLVKVAEKLSREEYIQVNNFIKSLGGFYSRFKHAFLFKEDPTEKLNAITQETIPAKESTPETATANAKEAGKESINYTITEDTHTKTGEKIWIVKPETRLNKTDFAEVKRKLATIKGWYSSYVNGFVFKYDPSEQLKTG